MRHRFFSGGGAGMDGGGARQGVGGAFMEGVESTSAEKYFFNFILLALVVDIEDGIDNCTTR